MTTNIIPRITSPASLYHDDFYWAICVLDVMHKMNGEDNETHGVSENEWSTRF
jgi:hypothetical protein